MITLALFLLVLGILIFVHEWGHFVMARRAGVRVERFSLGFGPALKVWHGAETEYWLSAVPWGGYVKLAGEEGDEGVTPVPGDFRSRSIGERLAVFVAGAGMNLIVAFVLMPLVYFMGIRTSIVQVSAPVVGYVEPGSPADKVGLREGDRILEVSGKPMATGGDVFLALAVNPGKTLPIVVDRGGQRIPLDLPVEQSAEDGTGVGGFIYAFPAVVGGTQPGLPAAALGLEPGDEIVSVAGTPVHFWHEMARIIRSHPGESIALGWTRNGIRHEARITPERREGRGIIGITPKMELVVQHYGLLESIRMGWGHLLELTGFTFVVLGKLLTGQLPMRAMSGPVGIAQQVGMAAHQGLANLLHLVAALSLQLGILNLLPLPGLDGGHVLFLAIEGIRRRPISLRLREIAQQVGLGLLIVLMAVVTFHDFGKVRPEVSGWLNRARQIFQESPTGAPR